MESNFWLERWQQGQIGFHQEQVNSYLIQNWPKLGAAKGDKILVPLCGKSKDMLWLHRQGLAVSGVELSDIAVKSFFEENRLTAKQEKHGAFSRWHAPGYSLLCGDFFALTAADIQDHRFVYDRASLIALPPPMRQKYAKHLGELLSLGTKVLLVTMEYAQQEMNGPPFSVQEHEVRELYSLLFTIEKVGQVDVLSANPHFRERGLSELMETTYVMTRKSPTFVGRIT